MGRNQPVEITKSAYSRPINIKPQRAAAEILQRQRSSNQPHETAYFRLKRTLQAHDRSERQEDKTTTRSNQIPIALTNQQKPRNQPSAIPFPYSLFHPRPAKQLA